ncbi:MULTISPECIES: PTS mannitol transporter subunit IICBA [Clostridium]|uniref:PTS mannitol transporter subunit IICBA n=1 Tax=Clostridium TaxID=1485 RepID=UPI0004BCD0FE|nr:MULTISPECIES: PTS mannitol transporter subunit IICBA [Clostridium]MDU3520299.1 PTS mannitol transporter subunit IICBA [Clostridium saudiense]
MIKEKVQSFGNFISSMIIPNIGAFIAWGFITAIFTPTGWFPNEKITLLVEPLTQYLLPLLVGITGGKVTGGPRGGVVAAISTIGVIASTSIPMVLGAMVMGPLSGYIIKKFDKIIKDKVPAGFEMLVNNFSLAIIGMILAIVGLFVIGPSMTIIVGVMNIGVSFIVKNGLLPLLAVFIEPIKVLFLNNAINHGIIDVIALDQVNEYGKSILYLLEANPGPGLGVILSYFIYSKGTMKQSAPSAAIIQFFGGIHEIYFPYILINPSLLLAAIIGSIVSIITFLTFNSGLIATASPGSIFSIMMLSHKSDILTNLLGVCVGAIVSFFISAFLLKRKYREKDDKNTNRENVQELDLDIKDIKKIVFACDVGMGSSAMGATNFRNRIKDFNLDIEVVNSSVANIPDDADIIITHKGLLDSIKKEINKDKIIFIENFLEDDNLEVLYEKLSKKNEGNEINAVEDLLEVENNTLLNEGNILLGLESESKEEAIIRAGELLFNNGYTKYEYIDSMLERENIISTYIGLGIAIPHGTESGKSEVEKAGIIVLQYPKGIKFGTQTAYLLIAVAAKHDEHLEIISSIAKSLEDIELIEKIKTTTNPKDILKAFNL